RRGGKARVPLAAEAAFGDHDRIAFRGEVRDQRPLVVALLVDLRADGNFERDVGAGLTGAERAFALCAIARLEGFLEAEVEERVEIGAGHEIDAATVPAVAAVRAAARHELLAAEAHGA